MSLYNSRYSPFSFPSMFDEDDFFLQPYPRRYRGMLPTSFHRAAADWMDVIDQDFTSFLNERETQQRQHRRHKQLPQQQQQQQLQSQGQPQQQLLNESKEESKDSAMTTTGQDTSLSNNNNNNNSNSSLSMFSSSHPLSFSSLRLKPNTLSDRYEYSTPVPPGLTKDQLELSVNDDLLTLSANVKQEEKDKQGNVISSSYRQVSRSISLPDDADLQKINARYDNGQLIIQVGRTEQAKQQGQRIMIQ